MAMAAQQAKQEIWPDGRCVFADTTRFSRLRAGTEEVMYCTSRGKQRTVGLTDYNFVIPNERPNERHLRIYVTKDCSGCPFYQPA